MTNKVFRVTIKNAGDEWDEQSLVDAVHEHGWGIEDVEVKEITEEA